ncbi:ketopantoate reductase family protein [Clostridium sp. PL3]|uniref:2-dehydropantoate 2-reductase n=1 Tax=Clostridium thailandense TaxID=2794346 RepID=A0A949TPY3_9CLOT|nr:ketopantoate reductase family protein [Clostridium thailandense]MBV7276804.1 ketopantoate reductase family protein [Clostridium thailandense]
MKRVAIMGVGSLGTIMGAIISKNGGHVDLIDSNKAHIDALNKEGATVTGKMNLKNIPVNALLPEDMEGIYDIIILLLKQTYNDVAIKQLLPHIGPNSVVCTLQNGVPEESVSEMIGAERVIGGTVGWGATWIAPGISELTSDVSCIRVDIGEQDGSITNRLKEVQEVLKMAGECVIVDNLLGIRWSKLIQNATLSGMSAALGCTYAEILDNDKAAAAAAWVGNEMCKIVRKRGIVLEDLVPGWSYYALEFSDKAGLEKSIQWLRDYFKPHRPLKASMLQDMEKRRKCEIDQIVGTPCKWGAKLSIPTPTCQTIVDIVKDFESGKISMPTMDCLDRFHLESL